VLIPEPSQTWLHKLKQIEGMSCIINKTEKHKNMIKEIIKKTNKIIKTTKKSKMFNSANCIKFENANSVELN
jgi:hypothetical protein